MVLNWMKAVPPQLLEYQDYNDRWVSTWLAQTVIAELCPTLRLGLHFAQTVLLIY